MKISKISLIWSLWIIVSFLTLSLATYGNRSGEFKQAKESDQSLSKQAKLSEEINLQLLSQDTTLDKASKMSNKVFNLSKSELFYESFYEQRMQQKISSEILRFHILAHSDSKQDQVQKLQVKSAVVEYMQPLLDASSSKEESIKILECELYNIEEIAQNLVAPRDVEVSVESDWFPQITYGDCTFPAGIYDTLRIEIGKAEGHNWWCVLYPGLCFSNAVKPVMTESGKNLLENVLDEECYDFLLHPRKTKIRFRWLGLEFFHKNR